MEGFHGVGRGGEEWWGKEQGIRSIIGRHKIDGDRLRMVWETEVKELICTTHEHKLRRGMLEGWGVQGRGEIKGENWEHCNSIIKINKMVLSKNFSLVLMRENKYFFHWNFFLL